jgi:hypothetical protein
MDFGLQEKGAEVGRNRVEAARMDDARTARARLCVVGIDHRAHPRHFGGQIAVVRARGSARGNERAAIFRIGSDGRAHDARLLRHGRHGRGVERIRDEDRDAEAERRELVAAPTRDGPAESWRRARRCSRRCWRGSGCRPSWS